MDNSPNPQPSGDDAPEQSQFDFEDPIYWTEERVEELLRDVAKQRRRMSRSERRNAKKAAKFARYPVKRCEIVQAWDVRRFAAFAITREKPSGDVAFASAVIDLACRGLKDAHFQPSVDEEQANQIIDGVETQGAEIVESTPAIAKKVLRHGTAFGAKNGFPQPSEYFALDRFLGDHDLSKVDTKIPLGHRGKPILIPGPNDDPAELAETLEKTVGANGYYTANAALKEDANVESQSSPAPDETDDDRSDDGGSDIIMPGDM